MPPPTPTTTKKIAESSTGTRQRLIDAAIEEFAVAGFEGATVRDICARAEASINAINYHFGDKQQLYVEAVTTAHRSIRGVMGREPTPPTAADLQHAPQQHLQRFIARMVTMAMAVERRSDFNHQLLFREIAKPTGALEPIVREFIRPHFEQLMEILTVLSPAGVERIELRLLALSVIGQCLHYKFAAPILPLLLTKTEQRQLTETRVAEHICRVTLASLPTART